MKNKKILENSIILNNLNTEKYLVVGTMSSGKSTFLNSLIGLDLFPSRNEACTAKTTLYLANPERSEFLYKHNYTKKPTLRKTLDSKQLEKWNESSRVKNVIIEGPLHTRVIGDFGLIDTPGPNNSMDKTHREVMQSALEKYEYKNIFYILNATQLGTDDDRNLLGFIKNKSNTSKIIFIVNKADEIDDNEAENLESVAENVKKYLASNSFENPIVFFVSALSALLATKVFNNLEMTKKEIRYYEKLQILLEKNLAIHNLNTPNCSMNHMKIENDLWNKSGLKEVLNII